jgi:hypothetical protein
MRRSNGCHRTRSALVFSFDLTAAMVRVSEPCAAGDGAAGIAFALSRLSCLTHAAERTNAAHRSAAGGAVRTARVAAPTFFVANGKSSRVPAHDDRRTIHPGSTSPPPHRWSPPIRATDVWFGVQNNVLPPAFQSPRSVCFLNSPRSGAGNERRCSESARGIVVPVRRLAEFDSTRIFGAGCGGLRSSGAHLASGCRANRVELCVGGELFPDNTGACQETGGGEQAEPQAPPWRDAAAGGRVIFFGSHHSATRICLTKI